MTDHIRTALAELLLMARTSGGTAGPDTSLMVACDKAESALAEQPAQPQKSLDWPTCTQINSGVLCGVPRKPGERLCPDCNPQPPKADDAFDTLPDDYEVN